MSHQANGLGCSARSRITNVSGIQVQRLIAKLDIVYPLLPDLLFLEIVSETDLARYFPGDTNGKHLLQELSILGHLRRINAVDASLVTAIELGAGTGRLSERLQRITESNLNHVLIDRRQLQDSVCRDRILKARADKVGRQVDRVVVDIATLELGPVAGKCLCMSKHLCGPACDLAIVSLGRCKHPLACALATCCHYLCDFECFAGNDFWLACGFSAEDFEVAAAASQWASLSRPEDLSNELAATTPVKPIEALPNLLHIAGQARLLLAKCDPHAYVASQQFEQEFTRAAKAELGVKLKHIFDLARASKLQQLGYTNVELVQYTSRSLENRLLIAY
jgi:tRNA:m4X modification enzyme